MISRKFFLIDWGEKCNGARYAMVSAGSKDELFWMIDSIGDVGDIKIIEIMNEDKESNMYLELTHSSDAYSNVFNEKLGEGQEEDIFERNDWLEFEDLKF